MRIGPSGVLMAIPNPYATSNGSVNDAGAFPASTNRIVVTSRNDGMSALIGNRYSRLASRMLVSLLNPAGSPRTVLGPPRMNRSWSGRQAPGLGTEGGPEAPFPN